MVVLFERRLFWYMDKGARIPLVKSPTLTAADTPHTRVSFSKLFPDLQQWALASSL